MNTHQSQSRNFQLLNNLEQLRKQFGFKSVSELVDEMSAVYAAFHTGLTVGHDMRPVIAGEASHLWSMAAENAQDLGALAAIPEPSLEMCKPLWLLETPLITAIRDKALDERQDQADAEEAASRTRPVAANSPTAPVPA